VIREEADGFDRINEIDRINRIHGIE